MTLQLLARHLRESGAVFTIEDGDVLLAGHRLGVSIAFDGFARQDNQVIAPLDIQLHLDGDDGNRFRVGTLGVGADTKTAGQDAVEQWYVLAAKPVLEALGASPPGKRRAAATRQVGRWELFAGQVGVRGRFTSDSETLSRLYLELFNCIHSAVARWQAPNHFELRSVYLMATWADGSCDVQAAQDGLVSSELSESIAVLHWPASADAYLYKQLFVLRGGSV